MSFIYVIASEEDNYCKIGFSKNPEKRLKQLQTGHPKSLSLHYTEEFPDDKVKRIEKIIHRTINHHRRHGEWFNLPVANAILEVKYALIRYGDE